MKEKIKPAKENVNKILLIDDDEVANYLNKKAIRDSGIDARIVSKTSAAKGLDYLRSKLEESPEDLPDMIMLDINMPIMNGWDFLDDFQKLKTQFPKEIKIVILTSSIYQKEIEMAKLYGYLDSFISKPLTDEKLIKIMS